MKFRFLRDGYWKMYGFIKNSMEEVEWFLKDYLVGRVVYFF